MVPFETFGVCQSQVLSFRLDVEIASQIIPVKHGRTARRHAAACKPAIIHTRQELHDFIRDHDIPKFTRTVDGERLLSFQCPNHDSVVVTTRRLLDILSQSGALMIHSDATYKVVQRVLCEQLYTIHVNWDGRVGTCLWQVINGSDH